MKERSHHVLMENKGDLEGAPRLALLLDPMQETTKPNTWKLKFPWTLGQILDVK